MKEVHRGTLLHSVGLQNSGLEAIFENTYNLSIGGPDKLVLRDNGF